ncbi:apoptosis-associated speck-like protein containing a CARD [Mobula birostris]|uniref:apoptosis-associated speck-like protein containing a CARD n=1 Tax=Mobula birostris TaxID=1983395 RepID=UPI003B28278C
MPRTVRQCIVEALENLGKSQLRRFKEDLSEVQYRPGFSAIPRGRLEDADAQDLGRLLVSTYRDDYAAELTLEVLEGLPEREVADSLRHNLPAGGQAPKTGSSGSAGGRAAATGPCGSAHPVDRYFAQIVQQFHSTDMVLDELLGKGVLTAEHYDRLRVKAPRQEKNRELLLFIRGQGLEAKEQLWSAMSEADPYFVGNVTRQ